MELRHQERIAPQILYQREFATSCVVYMNHYTLDSGPRSESGLLTQRRLSFLWQAPALLLLKILLLSLPSPQEHRAEDGEMGRTDGMTLHMAGLYAND